MDLAMPDIETDAIERARPGKLLGQTTHFEHRHGPIESRSWTGSNSFGEGHAVTVVSLDVRAGSAARNVREISSKTLLLLRGERFAREEDTRAEFRPLALGRCCVLGDETRGQREQLGCRHLAIEGRGRHVDSGGSHAIHVIGNGELGGATAGHLVEHFRDAVLANHDDAVLLAGLFDGANGRCYQFVPACPDRVDIRIGQKKIGDTVVGIVDLTGNLNLDLGDLYLRIIYDDSLEAMVAFSQGWKHVPVKLDDVTFATQEHNELGCGNHAVGRVVRADIGRDVRRESGECRYERDVLFLGTVDDSRHLRVRRSYINDGVEAAVYEAHRGVVGGDPITLSVKAFDGPALGLGGLGRGHNHTIDRRRILIDGDDADFGFVRREARGGRQRKHCRANDKDKLPGSHVFLPGYDWFIF